MSSLSPIALERIAAAENRERITPLLAFPAAVVRIRIQPNGMEKEGRRVHNLKVEYSDLSTKVSEHVNHEMVTLPEQLRVGQVGTALVVSYREGDGNWRALFTRELAAVTEDRLPVTEFDFRIK